MIKAVILDVDDTLCLTEEACFYLENQVLKDIGARPQSRKVHLETWGMAITDALAIRSPGADLKTFQEAFKPRIAEAIQSGAFDKISPENFAAIDELIESGYKVLLLTSRDHSEFAHILAPEHSLANRIEAFYYRDNMQFHKPDPRAFEQIEAGHGWKPSECVYVGDAVSDAQAANGAGIHFIASLESGLRKRADFKGLRVDDYIQTFPEVVQAVALLDNRLRSA